MEVIQAEAVKFLFLSPKSEMMNGVKYGIHHEASVPRDD